MKHDCTNLIERLPKHEERAGVTLKGVYAEAEDDGGWQVSVRAEAHSIIGDELPHTVEVVATVLDGAERVIDTNSAYLNEETFFEFEAVSLSFYDLARKPSKIRLHPKRG